MKKSHTNREEASRYDTLKKSATESTNTDSTIPIRCPYLERRRGGRNRAIHLTLLPPRFVRRQFTERQTESSDIRRATGGYCFLIEGRARALHWKPSVKGVRRPPPPPPPPPPPTPWPATVKKLAWKFFQLKTVGAYTTVRDELQPTARSQADATRRDAAWLATANSEREREKEQKGGLVLITVASLRMARFSKDRARKILAAAATLLCHPPSPSSRGDPPCPLSLPPLLEQRKEMMNAPERN